MDNPITIEKSNYSFVGGYHRSSEIVSFAANRWRWRMPSDKIERTNERTVYMV